MKLFQICLLCLTFRSHSAELDKSNLSESNEDWSDDVNAIINHLAIPVQALINVTVSADQIVYYLFNSSFPETYTIIDDSNASILSNSGKIVFLIHGWTQDQKTEWYELLKNAFIKHDYSVIEIDWSVYAKKGYFTASDCSKDVGHLLGEFVAGLIKKNFIRLERVVMVGHSLGGHVAGFLGKKVFEILGKKLKRIISLDPAGPLYEGKSATDRLAPTDAEVVHVIHTNGGQFGYSEQCGTIDFYPNGGTTQPGCLETVVVTAVTDGRLELCSHHRSWKYFAEALNSSSSKFESWRCADYDKFKNGSCKRMKHEKMGSLKTKETGNFFLDTNSESPFSQR